MTSLTQNNKTEKRVALQGPTNPQSPLFTEQFKIPAQPVFLNKRSPKHLGHLAYFCTLPNGYENEQFGGLCIRTGSDRVLDSLRNKPGLIKPIEFDRASEAEIAESNQAFGEAVA